MLSRYRASAYAHIHHCATYEQGSTAPGLARTGNILPGRGSGARCDHMNFIPVKDQHWDNGIYQCGYRPIDGIRMEIVTVEYLDCIGSAGCKISLSEVRIVRKEVAVPEKIPAPVKPK